MKNGKIELTIYLYYAVQKRVKARGMPWTQQAQLIPCVVFLNDIQRIYNLTGWLIQVFQTFKGYVNLNLKFKLLSFQVFNKYSSIQIICCC